jgi:hypothetical protein
MTRPNKPFINDTSQAERHETLRNDFKNTFLSHVHDAEEMGGRYKSVHTQTVVGSQEQIQYPRGPSWSEESAGVEPPLGYSVNDSEPCGEAHEVAESLKSAGPISPADCEGPGGDHGSDPAVVETSPPVPHQQFRRRI